MAPKHIVSSSGQPGGTPLAMPLVGIAVVAPKHIVLASIYHCINAMVNGAEGIRTPDPLVANEVLSQLSYSPEMNSTSGEGRVPMIRFRGQRTFGR